MVTLEPSRAQTDPSSRPIAPAPMTRNSGGGSVKVSASVLLTIVWPSNFANGNSIGALPVAMMMFLVSISCPAPAGSDDLTENIIIATDRKSTRLNSSHQIISYAVFCLKKKTHIIRTIHRPLTTHTYQ